MGPISGEDNIIPIFIDYYSGITLDMQSVVEYTRLYHNEGQSKYFTSKMRIDNLDNVLLSCLGRTTYQTL